MSKFQSYKNWINEKFKEESDPVRDMGIGIYHPVKYKTAFKAAKFVVKHLTTIMGVDKLPNDIINKNNPDVVHVFNNAYWPPVKEFLMKCVLTSDGRRELSFWSSVLKEMFILLQAMGYPKDVNEAFTDESDPVKDMGIGMLSKIEKYLKTKGKPGNIVHNRTNANIALDLFKDNGEFEYFKFLIQNPDSFDIMPNDLITSLQIAAIHQNYKFGKLLIKNGVDVEYAIENAKNRGMGTTAERLELLRDNIDTFDINEKFSEGGDPIADMGIGVFVPKTYGDPGVAAKFMYVHLKDILNTDEIPEDIINPLGHQTAFNFKYFPKIHDYIDKYIKNDTSFKANLQSELYRILHTLSYPLKRKNK